MVSGLHSPLSLLADILRSAIAPTWDEIGKLAAIIGLRTILNYFLGKEIEQVTHKKLAPIPESL